MPNHLLAAGDRFEVQVTREAWESGFLHLGGELPRPGDGRAEAIPVVLTSGEGRSVTGLWDVAGDLEARGLSDLLSVERYPFVDAAAITVEEVSRSRDEIVELVEFIRQELH